MADFGADTGFSNGVRTNIRHFRCRHRFFDWGRSHYLPFSVPSPCRLLPATGRLRRAAPTSSGAALSVRAAHRHRAARVPSTRMLHQPPTQISDPGGAAAPRYARRRPPPARSPQNRQPPHQPRRLPQDINAIPFLIKDCRSAIYRINLFAFDRVYSVINWLIISSEKWWSG